MNKLIIVKKIQKKTAFPTVAIYPSVLLAPFLENAVFFLKKKEICVYIIVSHY